MLQQDCCQLHKSAFVSLQVVAAPTGSGKTGVLELAMLRMLSGCLNGHGHFCHSKGSLKAVYLAPTKALVQASLDQGHCALLTRSMRLPHAQCMWTCLQEKTKAWQQSFGMQLALKVAELTGDVDSADAALLEDADIICTTPEKLGELDGHPVCQSQLVVT